MKYIYPMQAKNILSSFNSAMDQNVLMFYRGPLNNDILGGIGTYIRKILAHRPETSFKLFSIFIELAQNIYYHSDDFPDLHEGHTIKFGVLLIEENRDTYTITTGNYVTQADMELIKRHCDTINSLSVNELRLFKRERRKMERGAHGEANIGLIQVALTSEEPIMVDEQKIDEKYTFLTLSTDIRKN